jgi:hypothetical protein
MPSITETTPTHIVKSDRTGRTRYTRQYKQEVLAAFESSSLSAPVFAAQCGIKYPTFAAWIAAGKAQPPNRTDGSPTVSVVRSAVWRVLPGQIHRCHSMQIYDTYEIHRHKLQAALRTTLTYEVHQLLYNWLNFRSQRCSMTWRNYSERWKTWGMPAALRGGNIPESNIAPIAQTCMNDCQQHQSGLSRSACASSEEPGAVVPHAGICGGRCRAIVSLPQSAPNNQVCKFFRIAPF